MTSKSSYLPRLGFSRGDGPILPLHNRTSPPVRKKHSEYSLSELSPRPDDGLLSTSPENDHNIATPSRRGSSPSARHYDWATDKSSSKTGLETPPLFAGPPPPIATSQMIYRDEEDRGTSTPSRPFGATSLARNIGSVLFDRSTPSSSRTRNRDYDPKPDAIWRNLQRRELALQKELQHLLDAQSAGLAANLNPDNGAPGSSNPPSESGARGGGSTPGSSPTPSAAYSPGSSQRSRSRHVMFEDRHHYHHHRNPTSSVTSSGTIVPVRQPRPKPLGLRAARAGLTRSIGLLADLKAEEDAQLAAALSARKQALAQLRRWTARREDIAEELRLLLEAEDRDETSGTGAELRELEAERDAVARETAELEQRLAALRRRRARIDERLEEVRSRREAGLSGYRGALKEVEGKIGEMLTRPTVKPLDTEFFSSSSSAGDDHEGGNSGGGGGGGGGDIRESLSGVEFLQLRPERRTAEMAREWWENEVSILEKRKKEVDKERTALEQGIEVWRGAVKLVSEFEAELRNQLRENGNAERRGGGRGGGGSGNGKGKNREGTSPPTTPPPPEQTMLAQLERMRDVMVGLEERLHIAEENGWNLLICAIGAELEAFRQADSMLREALRAAGVNVGDGDGDGTQEEEDSTPRLAKSTGLENSRQGVDRAESSSEGKLVDLEDRDQKQDGYPESDNEVPPDLLVSAQEDHEPEGFGLSREDSNEIPAEFLREHDDEEEVLRGFGGMRR
ncbi:hypothetical protein VTH82DRAFT_6322 [Thermothelomyces myriococcoides]